LHELQNQNRRSMAHLRTPAVAGSFYPVNKDTLRKNIKNFLNKINFPKDILKSKIKAPAIPQLLPIKH
jgi:predicted class III extradiol MEMO1 family dioxygenase